MTVKTKQNYFLWTIVMGLLMLIVLVKIQCNLKTAPITQSTLANDFDWLRNVNYLSRFVRPEQITAKFVPKNISAESERHFITCFVISKPRNGLARNAIRETWGKLVKPIFLIGLDDNRTMTAIIEEAQTFDDIIIEDFIDSYVNLTIKTAFAMKSFIGLFANSKYFFKIDDDVFVNVKKLRELLKQVPSDSLIGNLEVHSKPYRLRDHKWYIPEFLFEDEEFPPYFNGPAYLIPGQMVQSIYNASMTIPFMTLEDVFFTGIIAGKMLNYTLHDSKRFKQLSVRPNYPCLYENYVTVHQISPTNLTELWWRLETYNNRGCGVFESIMAYFLR